MNRLRLCAIAVTVIASSVFSQQTYVNRIFQDDFASPVFNPIFNQFGIQWSKTIESVTGELITVGHTFVSGQGENMLVVKRGADGAIIWQTDYDVNGATVNDYAINVFETGSGDIYVCGTTDNGGSTNYDGVILRYNSSGTLLSSTTFPGSSGMNDIATALAIHPITGNLVVALTNENPTTSYDYLVAEFNTSSLAFLGSSASYDYANLVEIALGLEIDGASGEIMLIGGSQSSLLVSAYAVAIFNSSLGYTGDARTDLVGTPNDQPLAYKKDASNNIYITGKTLSGTTYNIRTVKINSNNTIAWNVSTDINGLDDVGNTIDLDPTNGNVIVGGLCTKTGGLTDMVCIRYNGSNGSVIGSPYVQAAENNSGNAIIKKICANSTGDVYFIGAEKGNSGFMQVVVGKVTSSGMKSWQRKIINPTQDLVPSDIEFTPDGIFAISIVDSVTDKYLMTGYEELTLDTTKTYSGGSAAWKKRELIVSFMPGAIDKPSIDNKVGTAIREFGNLSDFLTTSANNAVNAAFRDMLRDGEIEAIKIFDGQKTTDTVAISRLGENVPIPPFWSTLLLQIPSYISLKQAGSIFQSLPNVASYAHPNYFTTPLAPPNDSLYSQQLNLAGMSIVNINVEDAWTVTQNCGASFIKGGVFDTGIQWEHKDFGFNGSPTSGKVQGWYWDSNVAFPGTGQDLRTTLGPSFHPDQNGHGTNAAGIIGAERNNTSGVAGIAGGDGANSNPGVSLFSLNTSNYIPVSYSLKALYETCLSGTTTNNPYRYGLNFSNHSYKITYQTLWPDSFAAFREQVHFANRMQVTFVASRGNDSSSARVFPACFDSSWVLSVGGVGPGAGKWSGSSYGKAVDVVAPALSYQIKTTWNNKSYGSPGGHGTSNSAPHVSGVVALLMSYMNDPTGQNAYMNLAPEDCDYIIQRSAQDVSPLGYDSLTGYGILHAGRALRMVEKPLKILYHYGTNFRFPYTITKNLYSPVDTIQLTETFKNSLNQQVFNAGTYIVKTFQIDATVNHTWTYPTDSITNYWGRHSSTYAFDLFNAQKKLDLHQRMRFTSFSPTSASVRGYVYQVKDINGNPLGWWPCDTSFAALYVGNGKPKTLFEYSVLSKNRAVGIKENKKENSFVQVFPNPANRHQSIVVDSEKESDCTIELYDLMGRQIKIVYSGHAGTGKTVIDHNVADLPNSMYIYIIRLGDKTLNKKFIKE